MQPAVIASQGKLVRSGTSASDYSRSIKHTSVAKISNLSGVSAKKKWKIMKETVVHTFDSSKLLMIH